MSGDLVPQRAASIAELIGALEEHLRLDVAEGDASPRTLRAYVTHIGQFVAWCADSGISPGQATDRDLVAYRRHLVEAGLTRSTIGVKLSALRRFYEMARAHGLRPDNPATGLRPPRSHTTRRDQVLERYFSEDEIRDILSVPDLRTETGVRDRAMLALLYLHGLRASEISGLSTNNLSVSEGRLRVKGGKGGKDRTIILNEISQAALAAWLKIRRGIKAGDGPGTSRVFLSLSKATRGKALSIAGVRWAVNAVLKAAGTYTPGRSCHAFRHSHAAHAIAAGADVVAVQEELGHANLATTSVYTRVANAGKQNPANFIKGVLETPKEGEDDRTT